MQVKFCSEEFIDMLLGCGITANETIQDRISSILIFPIVTLFIGFLNSAET